MVVSIAHLGPKGTYSEVAALAFAEGVHRAWDLRSYANIDGVLAAIAAGDCTFGVVPVENSIQGSVTVTLDRLWQLQGLQVCQALVLPISHAILSMATSLETVQVVYSHPQALAQCYNWLQEYLPQAKQIASASTAESLQHLKGEPMAAAIASRHAAELYHLNAIAHPINDYPGNCTRFWVVAKTDVDLDIDGGESGDRYTSIAFSLPENAPGALLDPLQVLADRGINLTRIESRPTKRLLGEYLFFIDFEGDGDRADIQDTLNELRSHTEILKILGSYSIINLSNRGALA